MAREAAAAIEAKAIADCAEADARIAAGLHANGAPMFSTTTFKDNGEPIMLDDQGKRSVFCDIADDADAAKPAANVVQLPTPQEAAARILAARLPEVQKTPPTLKLGQIGERLGFSLTGDFLKNIGFEPAARDKSALLFHERDFALICMRLVSHIQQVQAKQAA